MLGDYYKLTFISCVDTGCRLEDFVGLMAGESQRRPCCQYAVVMTEKFWFDETREGITFLILKIQELPDFDPGSSRVYPLFWLLLLLSPKHSFWNVLSVSHQAVYTHAGENIFDTSSTNMNFLFLFAMKEHSSIMPYFLQGPWLFITLQLGRSFFSFLQYDWQWLIFIATYCNFCFWQPSYLVISYSNTL